MQGQSSYRLCAAINRFAYGYNFATFESFYSLVDFFFAWNLRQMVRKRRGERSKKTITARINVSSYY